MDKIVKTCDTCVSRLICPINYRVCDGWNEKELFWSFLKLHFYGQDETIDRLRLLIEETQKGNKYKWKWKRYGRKQNKEVEDSDVL